MSCSTERSANETRANFPSVNSRQKRRKRRSHGNVAL